MCEVIERVKSLRGSEREVVADLVQELSVIYKERLFAEAGYPSLFVFCTEGLGYTGGAAFRRVEEMQLIEQAKKILSTSKVKATLLGATKKLIQRAQRLERVREKRRAKKAEDELNTTRGSLRNSNSNIEQEEVLTISSRYIPAEVRHQVEQRDGCQCSFVAADGRRCSETRNLHFDHITPHALGGKSTTANLRVLCATHNALEAEKVFGEAAIRGLVQFKQRERLAPRSAG